MLKNSGRQEAIQAAQQRGIALAAEEISQKTGGKINVERMRGVTGGRAGAPSGGGENLDDGIGYQEPGRELSHESMSNGVGYSDRGSLQFSLHSESTQTYSEYLQHHRKRTFQKV